jgi:ATP-dependent helicase HepA
MSPRNITVGGFVWGTGAARNLGIGKVIAISGETVSVEHFHSVARRTQLAVPVTQVQRLEMLASQTRCYVPRGDGRWVMGRIGRWFEGEYEVFFREGQACFLPEAQLFIRCQAPVEDPTETLIYHGHETPYFHDRRFRFVRSLTRQRAAARGMTGLLSSRIDLFPHQVETVRRVLEDPVQRYLLSDEVGLGKTIEACVVLRQFLLDDPTGAAAVLVPPLLVDQWREELEAKFQISRFGARRVEVIATDSVSEVLRAGTWGMVVIDEAQHVAAKAFLQEPSEKERFRAFQQLCHSADRLLLLSATPVLNNERDFLAMLHLLDPQVYRLDDVEAFRERVRRRQKIGHLLLSLREGSPRFILHSSLKRLAEIFPSDTCLQELAEELRGAVDAESVNAALRDRLIRAIRVHISETYRLHRRMLRNRRSTVELGSLLGRPGGAQSDTPRILEHDLDERSLRVHELLEEWRETAAISLGRDEAKEASTTPLPRNHYARVFILLLQCAGSWFEMLDTLLAMRLRGASGEALTGDFSPQDLDLLTTVPLFPGETDILNALRETLRTPSEEGDRIRLLELAIRNVKRAGGQGPPPKCVVFTSFTRVARKLIERLSAQFGEAAVSSYHQGLSPHAVELAITRFRKHPSCFVLVCDRAGEEGRNLQFADRVIHFDVPFSPNRVEQRIGRLDRIGRTRPVRSTIFIGPACEQSILEAWYRVLNEGFRVFDTSIASLQFYVDAVLPTLTEALFTAGAQGLLEQLDAVRKGIAEEEERISEQDALDAIDASEQEAANCFQSIQELEASHKELEDDFHAWVGEALLFRRDPDFYRTEGLIYYTLVTDRWGQSRTLVPSDWLEHRLKQHLDHPGTFERAKALKNQGATLFRIGEGLIDTMAGYVRWDDRGQTFALWRKDLAWDARAGAEWTGFRFNYVISTDLSATRRVLKAFGLPALAIRSLSRQADAFFPPLIEIVYLDSDGRTATDPKLISILKRPYLQHSKGGTDFNLANDRLAVLDQLVEPTRWAELCLNAKNVSAGLVMERGEVPLRARCDEFAKQAERALSIRLEQLRLRLGSDATQLKSTETVSGRDLELERALHEALVSGIRTPQLRLDSLGFYVVSGRTPHDPDASREEAHD